MPLTPHAQAYQHCTRNSQHVGVKKLRAPREAQQHARGTPADPRVTYVRRKILTQGTSINMEDNVYVTEPRHTDSLAYVRPWDRCPAENKKKKNRAMVYFPTESGVGHVRKR